MNAPLAITIRFTCHKCGLLIPTTDKGAGYADVPTLH